MAKVSGAHQQHFDNKRSGFKKDRYVFKSRKDFKSDGQNTHKNQNRFNKKKIKGSEDKKECDNIKPSYNSSDDFFVKPVDKLQVSKSSSEKIDNLSRKSVSSQFHTGKRNNANKDETSESFHEKSKKPFNKKLWREQKYSNKHKIQQWEEKRKKALTRRYHRSLKNEPKLDVRKIYEEDEDDTSIDKTSDKTLTHESEKLTDNESSQNKTHKKVKPFKTAFSEYERMKEEKERKKEEALKRKAEKEKALQEYKKRKFEKYKKLSMKTKKGQPIMKGRIELLLEKIQRSVANE